MFSTVLAKAKEMAHAATYVAYSRLLPGRSFEYGGLRYPYFYHRYNNTCETERCIEIPLARTFLASRLAGSILEIGNVLNHYGAFPHTVVDKYEAADDVINADVYDFAPGQKYDAIVSVSTIEHVGWDEEPFDPQKAIRAIARLRQMLTTAGAMLLTFPIGHNEGLDESVRNGTFGCASLRGMKRASGNNWAEVPASELLAYPLDPPYLHNYPKYRRTRAVAFAYF